MSKAASEIDRPLGVGEVLAAAARIFTARPWPCLGMGVVEAVALLAASVVPAVAALAILTLSFGLVFAVLTRVVADDPFATACRRAATALPVLVLLAVIVAVPFYLPVVAGLIFLVVSAAWLGLTAFAIPVVMVEEAPKSGPLERLARPLRRTVELARTDYLHAAAVAGVLVLVYVLLSIVLAAALSGYADNGQLAAQAIAQVVLSPFFFLGLTVLYFEQQVRAGAVGGAADEVS